MNFIIDNQGLIIPLLAAVVVWIIGAIFKRQLDKQKISALLTLVLDIVQDIANGPETRALENHEKKELAVARVEAALPPKKKTFMQKVFGSVGGAVEFVWKNRKWLFLAAGKVYKAVF